MSITNPYVDLVGRDAVVSGADFVRKLALIDQDDNDVNALGFESLWFTLATSWSSPLDPWVPPTVGGRVKAVSVLGDGLEISDDNVLTCTVDTQGLRPGTYRYDVKGVTTLGQKCVIVRGLLEIVARA